MSDSLHKSPSKGSYAPAETRGNTHIANSRIKREVEHMPVPRQPDQRHQSRKFSERSSSGEYDTTSTGTVKRKKQAIKNDKTPVHIPETVSRMAQKDSLPDAILRDVLKARYVMELSNVESLAYVQVKHPESHHLLDRLGVADVDGLVSEGKERVPYFEKGVAA